MHRREFDHKSLLVLLAITSTILCSKAEALTVNGQVRAERAGALAGATVSLLPMTESENVGSENAESENPAPAAAAPAPAVSKLKTGEDGSFHLPVEQPGLYVLRIEAPGFVPMEHRLESRLEDLRLPDVELARDTGLWVRVKTAGGQPLAEALVAGSPVPRTNTVPRGWLGASRSGLTDKDGRVRLSRSQGEKLAIQASRAGFAHKRIEISSKTGPHLEIALYPVLNVTGKVVDPAGRPIAEAEIRAFSSKAPLRAVAQCASGADGTFRLSDLKADDGYRIEVHREGYGPAHREIPAAAHSKRPEEIVFVLRSGRAAFGTIRDQAAEPVKAARVVLVPQDDKGRPLPAVVSDQAGVFRFESIPSGSFALSVKATGFAPLTLPNLVVPTGSDPWDLGTAFLAPGTAIEGRVVQGDGSAVAGARVGVLSEDSPKGTDSQVLTDEDGRFTLADQITGMPSRLEVTAQGFISVLTPAVVPPTSEPITITLAPSSQVSGTVFAGGNPVEDAVVVAAVDDGSPLLGRRFYTVSDAEGHFLLQDLEPGKLALSASAEGYAESRRISLVLPAGERRENIEIHLDAGGTVSGTVSSNAGTPLEGVTIEAFSETGESGGGASGRPTAVSDTAGRFRISGLQPGSWLFSASHTGFPRKVARQRIGNGNHSLDFILDSGPDVTGRVTDESGTPVPGARVFLSLAGGRPRGLDLLPPVRDSQVVSQADGSFRFTGIEDGSYRLLASKAGFAPAEPAETFTIAGVPLGGLVLRLEQGSSISGRLLGLSYDELARIEIFAFRAEGRRARGEVDPAGGYRLPDLAPGPWHVVAEVEETGKRAIGQVTVGAEPASLDLDFANQPPAIQPDPQPRDL